MSIPKPYYENAAVKLYHGNCLELMAEIGGMFDAVVSDPPYGIGEHKWDKPIDWPRFFASANPLCKRNAAKILFCDMRSACRMIEANSKEYRYDLVYWKRMPVGFLNVRVMPLRSHENICVFYTSKPVYNPQMWESVPYSKPYRVSRSDNYGNNLCVCQPVKKQTSRFPLSVIGHGFSTSSRHKDSHPTAKPVELMEYLIKTYTNEGDMVLDPFAGGGSTGIAAMRTGRKAVLIELEERFCELAAQRLEAEPQPTNQLK